MKKDYMFVAQVLRQPESKEVKIEIPEGYEIDKENSTFEKIVFKKKDPKSRSWEEYFFKHPDNFVNLTFPDNKALQNKFIAYTKLMLLREEWIGNWKPSWRTVECVIGWDFGHILTVMQYTALGALSFPTKEMAEEFLGCFKDLLEQAKDLY